MRQEIGSQDVRTLNKNMYFIGKSKVCYTNYVAISKEHVLGLGLVHACLGEGTSGFSSSSLIPKLSGMINKQMNEQTKK